MGCWSCWYVGRSYYMVLLYRFVTGLKHVYHWSYSPSSYAGKPYFIRIHIIPFDSVISDLHFLNTSLRYVCIHWKLLVTRNSLSRDYQYFHQKIMALLCGQKFIDLYYSDKQMIILTIFFLLVVVQHILEYGQSSSLYATPSSLLWNQEKACKTQELCQDPAVYGEEVSHGNKWRVTS